MTQWLCIETLINALICSVTYPGIHWLKNTPHISLFLHQLCIKVMMIFCPTRQPYYPKPFSVHISQCTGHCQCFQSLNCTGDVRVLGYNAFRDCCMDTDDGLSWRGGDGTCTNCIGKRKHLLILCLNHGGCGVSLICFFLVA